MPEPESDESKDEFIERCMGDDTMNEDFPEEGQRFAVCQAQWEKSENVEDNLSKIKKTNRGIEASTPRHTPLRCFEGNAQPYEPFWKIVNAAESDSGQAELELYGLLSEYSWWDDDITPRKFKDELYKVGQGGPVMLKINSPGGDVIAASVMRAILTDYPGEVTARVDGIAASAAVALTIAAKNVPMLDSAYMMIHDPAVVVFLAALDIETLGKLHTQLIDIKDGLVAAYVEKTGMSNTRISHMMTDETWMSARQAVEYGFADAVIPGGQKQQNVNAGFVNCLRNYTHVPMALMDNFVNIPPVEETSDLQLTDDMKREAQNPRDLVTNILRKED